MTQISPTMSSGAETPPLTAHEQRAAQDTGEVTLNVPNYDKEGGVTGYSARRVLQGVAIEFPTPPNQTESGDIPI